MAIYNLLIDKLQHVQVVDSIYISTSQNGKQKVETLKCTTILPF